MQKKGEISVYLFCFRFCVDLSRFDFLIFGWMQSAIGVTEFRLVAT